MTISSIILMSIEPYALGAVAVGCVIWMLNHFFTPWVKCAGEHSLGKFREVWRRRAMELEARIRVYAASQAERDGLVRLVGQHMILLSVVALLFLHISQQEHIFNLEGLLASKGLLESKGGFESFRSIFLWSTKWILGAFIVCQIYMIVRINSIYNKSERLSSGDSVRIIVAIYGCGGKYKDVTDDVKTLLLSESGIIMASNKTFKCDPSPGEYKALTIRYMYHGNEHYALTPEGTSIKIPIVS